MKVNWDDDIPNIWENESHVPNHQPEMHLIILDSNRTMRRPEPQRTQPYAILGEVDLLDLPSRNFTQPWKMGCLRMMYILKGVMFRGCHGYSYSIVWLYIYITSHATIACHPVYRGIPGPQFTLLQDWTLTLVDLPVNSMVICP